MASRNLTRDLMILSGVAVLLLSAVFVPHVLHHKAAGTAVVLADDGPPQPPSTAGEYRGIALQLHSCDENVPFEQFVEEIAKTGANAICLSVAANQENAKSSSIFIDYRKVPSVERMVKLCKLARRKGLRVIFMPIVLLENPGASEWRGKIEPAQPDAWWEDYENYVLWCADVASKGEADVFMVGSELVLLEDQTKRWRGLIQKVRKSYSGKLSYSANWDHYENIEWWKDLDMVGMTSYYDLVGDKTPSLEVLLENWKPIKTKILDWQKKVGKPIIFTEVGWPSQEGCAKEPWNYYGSTKPDVATQALCFEAFFKAWQDEKTVAGVLVWEWRNQVEQVGGANDISYVPTGKPAMKKIREYFSAPGAWRSLAVKPPTTTSAPAEIIRASNTKLVLPNNAPAEPGKVVELD